MTKRCGKPSNKWISSEAKFARRTRRQLERRYRRTRSEAARQAYRAACRHTNRLFKESRRAHYAEKLSYSDGDARKKWNVIKKVLHTDERPAARDADDCQKTCDGFCSFFSDKLAKIGIKIRDIFASGTLPPSRPLALGVPNNFTRFSDISDNEAIQAIRDLPGKSSPLDYVPTSKLKSCGDVFGPLIARLANLSFAEGSYPDMFKVGQVTPLLKKPGADTEDMANYRPITNLNIIGKTLERLAQKQLRRHIETSPNVGTMQSAYRALHSTETAMTRVVSDLLTATDSKAPSVLLSLDISAAFDTLDHHRLLNRARDLFGFDGIALDWLSSYLSGREQYVSIGGHRSPTVKMSAGVPQGSVLGPLLFSVLPVVKLISSFGINYHQYADDTQLYTAITSGPDSVAKLSACADAVTGWHIENDLLLNPNKTEALVVGTRQQVAKFDQTGGVMVSGTKVPFVPKIRVLGVTIDSDVSFDHHITTVVRACNYHIRALRHIRSLITQDAANTIACSIVCSRLDYCNSILYGVTEQNLNRLQRVQNSLARTVCASPYRTSATGLRRALHWLPIRERIVYKIAMMTFKVRLYHQPTYLDELVVDYIPTRSLRSSDKTLLVEPRTKTQIASRAFRVSAPHIWNGLPQIIRSANSIGFFRERLKTHLFGSVYN